MLASESVSSQSVGLTQAIMWRLRLLGLVLTIVLSGFSLLAPCSADTDTDTEKRLKSLEDEMTKMRNTGRDTMRDEFEERVANLEDLAKIGTLRSCAEYAKFGLKSSGPYMVDPDGRLIGQAPFQVQP